MPAFLTLDSVSARTPDHRTLFTDLTFSIATDRVGLVGRNGSGKSTLIRMIAGEIAPAEGAIRRTGTVGTLRQDWPDTLTMAQALGVADGLERLRRVLSTCGSAEDFDGADWTLEARIETALATVVLPNLSPGRTIATLSGGERTRLGVA